MATASEFDLYIRAKCTLICVVSREEQRVQEQIKAACAMGRGGRVLYVWDHADYFRSLSPGAPPPTIAAKDALSVLEAIDKTEGEAVFLLNDFHQCWDKQPRVIRKLRNLAHRLKTTKKTIFVTMPTYQLPEELRDDAVVIEFDLPKVPELDAILGRLTATPGIRVDLTPLGREKLLQATLGMTANQAQRVFAKAIVSDGVLDDRDIDLIIKEKKQIIRESGALEFFAPSETINDVGGLEVLKEWLKTRERAFGQQAREYGLPEPKGITLIGIPGTGKSLTAKTIAGLWHLPLIRLDVGALFGSLVGEAEANTRRALHLADTVAPCVLWIDEIEKGLATGSGDAGVSQRVFGYILTWMQEKTKPVFVVATANDVSLLRPELLRKGRFDEIFFLDLPTYYERREILQVHLQKRGRLPQDFALDGLATASEGYVGAEIEQAIIDAMYLAFSSKRDPGREFTTDDILEALRRQIPLSRSQRGAVEELRRWLTEGRALSASFAEVHEAEQQFVQLEPPEPGDPKRRSSPRSAPDGDDQTEPPGPEPNNP
jgi:AAA+ superfamily predicted ATPase